MDEFYQTSLSKFRELRLEGLQLRKELNNISTRVHLVEARSEALRAFLDAELEANPDLNARRELDRILAQDGSQALTSQSEINDESFNKTRFVLDVWANAKQDFTPKELFDVVRKTQKGSQISLAYINNVIYRVRKNKRATQDDDGRYHLLNGVTPESATNGMN